MGEAKVGVFHTPKRQNKALRGFQVTLKTSYFEFGLFGLLFFKQIYYVCTEFTQEWSKMFYKMLNFNQLTTR